MTNSTAPHLHLAAASDLREGDVFALRLGYRATVIRVDELGGGMVEVRHTVTRPDGSTFRAAVDAARGDAFSLLNRETDWH